MPLPPPPLRRISAGQECENDSLKRWQDRAGGRNFPKRQDFLQVSRSSWSFFGVDHHTWSASNFVRKTSKGRRHGPWPTAALSPFVAEAEDNVLQSTPDRERALNSPHGRWDLHSRQNARLYVDATEICATSVFFTPAFRPENQDSLLSITSEKRADFPQAEAKSAHAQN